MDAAASTAALRAVGISCGYMLYDTCYMLRRRPQAASGLLVGATARSPGLLGLVAPPLASLASHASLASWAGGRHRSLSLPSPCARRTRDEPLSRPGPSGRLLRCGH